MIRRTRLLDALVSHDHVLWLIEAGSGYGKTMLLNQLFQDQPERAVFVRRPGKDHGVGGFLTALDRSSSAGSEVGPDDALEMALAAIAGKATLIVDAIDDWDDSVCELLCEIAEISSIQMVAAARAMPSTLASLDSLTRTLGIQDLAFDHTEIEAEMSRHAASPDAKAVHEACEGWPVAAALMLERMSPPDNASLNDVLTEHEGTIDSLLHPVFRALDEVDIQTAKICANLPKFTIEIAELIGSPSVVDRLRRSGLPLRTATAGWLTIPHFVRSAITRSRPEPFKVPTAVTDHLVDRGEILAAIQSCLAVGEHESAAQLISELSFEQQTKLDPVSLSSAMTTIGAAANEWPRSLLVQAQVCATFGEIEQGAACLERAAELVENADRDLSELQSLEIMLEVALWAILRGDRSGAENTLDRCAPLVDDLSLPHFEAKVHDIRGLISHTQGSVEALEIAASEQRKALALWRQLSEPRYAAVTVFRLVSGPLAALGRRSEALQLLEDLPSVGPVTLINQARLNLEKAILLPYLGRAPEVPAIADEVRKLAVPLERAWLSSWALWAEIVACSFVPGQEEATLQLVDTFQSGDHYVLNDFTQFLAWGEIAEALARCRYFERAQVARRRAEELGGPEVITLMVATSLQARAGDAAAALESLNELRDHHDMEHGRRWLLALLEALCFHRLGESDRAQSALVASKQQASDLGQPELPSIVERRVVDLIGSDEPADGTRTMSTVEMTLFDSFTIVINGVYQPTPKGHAITLLKLLAVSGGQIVIDQAIDPLWPEADLSLGRRRLRNVVARIRKSYGDIVEREDDIVKLAPIVTSDLLAARSLAAEALGPESSTELLTVALVANDRSLLPENRYDDWAEDARQTHQGLVERLQDELKSGGLP